MNISSILAELVKEDPRSRTEIAESCNISLSLLNQYCGDRQQPWDRLELLLKSLGYQIEIASDHLAHIPAKDYIDRKAHCVTCGKLWFGPTARANLKEHTKRNDGHTGWAVTHTRSVFEKGIAVDGRINKQIGNSDEM